MAFAQLTYRESLRDIEACLRAQGAKLYHMGIRGAVSRRFPDWWDENLTWNMTTKTIWRIMEEDRGITRFAATGPKINLSGFSKNGLPTCDTVRAMAIYQEEH